MEKVNQFASFQGSLGIYRHDSAATATPMEFAVYQPDNPKSQRLPVLFYLSGLTCTWANAAEKAGLQRLAAQYQFIVVLPDTSPRGSDLPGEHDSYDFGSGAGFYVNATQEPWCRHYNMFDYVTDELYQLVATNFPADLEQAGVLGHSMGGHGALLAALKRPDRFKTCSAFSPICAPTQVPWGEKTFRAFFGEDTEQWRQWDASLLIADSAFGGDILVDQGLSDQFLAEQLCPEALRDAAAQANKSLTLRMHEGYDHSYYFIATFLPDHFEHHHRQFIKV